MSETTLISWADRYDALQVRLLLEDTVTNGTVYPRWIGESGQFWYDRTGDCGTEYRIVDASTAQYRVVFTHAAVAEALASEFDADVDPELLVLKNLQISLSPDRAEFDAFGEAWLYDFHALILSRAQSRTDDQTLLVSPDGNLAIFLRDGNAWVRELATGTERALTTDGTPKNAYAQTCGPKRSLNMQSTSQPQGLWSPDSTRFLTVQTDERHIPDFPYVEYAPPDGLRPRAHSNPTSLPSDLKPTEFRVLSIDIATGRQIEARYPRFPAVRMNDTIFSAGLAWWAADGRMAYFVALERGERTAHLVKFDVETGAVREIFSETADTYLELGVNVYDPTFIFPLPATNEFIWYSERSGHGHLYLYDIANGTLKHPITSGTWQVREVQHVDDDRREIFLSAGGISPDEDPYICKPCIVGIDSGALRIVSSKPGDHVVWRQNTFGLIGASMLGANQTLISGLSPDGDYFVETVGAIDRLPETTLRRRTGEEILVLEKADGRNLPADWLWPERIKLKAADGITDTYGVLFKPPGYSPEKSYPLINYIYGGPQTSVAPTSAFATGPMSYYSQVAAYAALGAFTLILDGRGTAYRERSFREASYGALETASNLEDHIAAIRQLAERYPAIDLQRIGITGFSGGGYAAATAALRFGDFFRVAVAGGGNYDQRLFWHCWGDRYEGPYSEERYASQAVKTYADGLTGKLLLIHGLLDHGCHPAGLFQLVQALIDANKDVDLVVLPRARHELTGYGRRRLVDYFVIHLFGDTPPKWVSFIDPFDEYAKRMRINAEPLTR